MMRFNDFSLLERFEMFTELSYEGCWLWLGSLSKGYGHIRINGVHRKANRVSYELFIGPIPEGMDVLHKCDNPPCVRPDHFFPGTHTDNMKDCISKKRNAFGERHGRVKLTDEQVKEIRRVYSLGNSSHQSLAEIFGVTDAQIGRIIRRAQRRV
jgi:hypothetical protein